VDPLVAAAKSQGESFVNALNKDDARVLAKALKVKQGLPLLKLKVDIKAALARGIGEGESQIPGDGDGDGETNIEGESACKARTSLVYLPHVIWGAYSNIG